MKDEELLLIGAAILGAIYIWKYRYSEVKNEEIKLEEPSTNPETQKQPVISTNNAQQEPTKVEDKKLGRYEPNNESTNDTSFVIKEKNKKK